MKRDKTQDDRPGGPDERFDRVERMIERGQYNKADHAIAMLRQALLETDIVKKWEDRLPDIQRQVNAARARPHGVIAVAATRVTAEQEPRDVRKDIDDATWLKIDDEAWAMVCKRMAVHADEQLVKDQVADDLVRRYRPRTVSERKRIVAKVFDHVEAWQRLREDEAG